MKSNRTFFRQGPTHNGALVFLFLGLLLWSSCAENDSDPRVQTDISAEYGHRHVVLIRYRQLKSGIRTFLLDENLSHNHTIDLTLEDSALLEMGFPVVVESSLTALHTHHVMLQRYQQ